MKKYILASLALIALSCSNDFENTTTPTTTPIALQIADPVGIQLESNFITTEARMNVKLQAADKCTVKIIDIAGRVVSSEKIETKAGDNLLTVYTKALPRSSYQLQLFNSNNEKIGQTVINLL